MKQIENIDLTKLHTDVALGYLMQIAEKTSLVTVEADQAAITSYKAATSAFNEVMKPNTCNSFTEARKAADEVTDKLCTGIRMYAEAITYSPDTDIAAIGKSAFASIQKYGHLTRMGYKEQYPNLQGLLTELKEIPKMDLDKAGLSVWITALDIANANFMNITADKIDEDSHKQVGIVQDSRNAAEDAYYVLIARINAGAVYLGDANYAAFIDTVNVIVGEYKAMIAAAKTRAEHKAANDGGDEPAE